MIDDDPPLYKDQPQPDDPSPFDQSVFEEVFKDIPPGLPLDDPRMIEAWAEAHRRNVGPPRPAQPCLRCGTPSESAPLACMSWRGHNIDNVILCSECRALQVTNRRAFWDEGWPTLPKESAEP